MDSNGSVVAMATVPATVQCCCMSSDCTQPQANVVISTSSGSAKSEQQLRSGDNMQGANLQLRDNAQQLHQTQCEPTFSFTQLGSGGQVLFHLSTFITAFFIFMIDISSFFAVVFVLYFTLYFFEFHFEF